MNLHRTCTLAYLATVLPVTEADVLGLTDPKLCYILDGVLLLYSVIITALYFKNKFSKAKDEPQKESLYAFSKAKDEPQKESLYAKRATQTGYINGYMHALVQATNKPAEEKKAFALASR
ncbi:UNVERIFIED_CONTAM: hypothetical protein FKN15_063445 [Acipenser sinensis]